MKLKYMLRGLGIGIVITAAAMGAYNRNAVADARVAVLKEYGLGEESRLVEETQAAEETSEAADVPPATEPAAMRNEEIESEIHSVLDAARESEQAGTAEDAASDGEEGQPEAAPEPSSDHVVVVTPTDENDAPGEAVQIVVSNGDDSGTVARKLYNAGLIGNAEEYDAFLMQHGYDKKLNKGIKTIYATDNWQEIAEKLTHP